MQSQELERIARQIRLRDVQAVFEAGAGHVGGEMSAIDIMTALYFRVLRIWPNDPKNPARDRFVLSKGHTACALYVTLAKRGFIPEEEISTFLQPNSRLNGHPNCNKVPGVETNTGPLGHGLPVAVGMATAAKLSGEDYHTYVMTGDGEMQEGSNWEAIMSAAQFKLNNLTLVIDHNRFQQGAAIADTNDVAPLRPKLALSATCRAACPAGLQTISSGSGVISNVRKARCASCVPGTDVMRNPPIRASRCSPM